MSSLLVLKLSEGYRVEAFFVDTHYYLYEGEGCGLGVDSMGHIHLGLSKANLCNFIKWN